MSTLQPLGAVTDAARSRARRSSIAPHLALLVTIVIWSANATVLKIGVAHVRPVPFAAVRFLIAGLFMISCAFAMRQGLRPRPPLRLLVPAALFGVVINQLAFTYGVQLSTAVDASMIMGLSPLLVAIGLFAVSRRRPPLRRLAGLGIGFVGLMLVVAPSARSGGGTLPGDLVAILAPSSWAVYILLSADAARSSTAVAFLTWTMLASLVALLPLGVLDAARGGNDWPPAVPALLFSGVLATGVAYALYLWALPRLGVTETAVYTYLQPLLGAVAASVFLHEPFGPLQIAGAASILLAAYLGSWSRISKPE